MLFLKVKNLGHIWCRSFVGGTFSILASVYDAPLKGKVHAYNKNNSDHFVLNSNIKTRMIKNSIRALVI